MINSWCFLRAGPRKTGAKSGSGSDGVSGEKVRFEPELDHQVGNEQKHKMEHFPIFIDNNQHAEFDKQPIVDQNGLMYTCSAISERKST